MAELALSISECTQAKFTLLFPLYSFKISINLLKRKSQKSKEVERSLSCGSLMQGENSGLPLKGFSKDLTNSEHN